uniref:Uncharacterized protein n=1 Tax=Arundo donax TaxID=35708 RepID=A0A0A9E2B9_ARUDO
MEDPFCHSKSTRFGKTMQNGISGDNIWNNAFALHNLISLNCFQRLARFSIVINEKYMCIDIWSRTMNIHMVEEIQSTVKHISFQEPRY